MAINELLASAASSPFLSTHDGHKPHLHFAADGDDIVDRVMAITAGGLAIFAVESEGGRLGACLREGCPEVFVDTSRNGRRRYCSTRCGNHDAVQRHRATHRASATGPAPQGRRHRAGASGRLGADRS